MKFICNECKKESTWLTNGKLHIEGKPVCDSCWDLEFPESRVIKIRTTSHA